MRIHFYQTSFLDELEPTARNYMKKERWSLAKLIYFYLFIIFKAMKIMEYMDAKLLDDIYCDRSDCYHRYFL